MTKLIKRPKSARRSSITSNQFPSLPKASPFSKSSSQKVDEKQVTAIQTEIIDSQKRTISTLLESELVAANTGIALKQQGETLAKTKQLTHRISLSLHKSDRDIRAIKSWAGAIFNKFVKPGAGGALSQENREQAKNSKNERLQNMIEFEHQKIKVDFLDDQFHNFCFIS